MISNEPFGLAAGHQEIKFGSSKEQKGSEDMGVTIATHNGSKVARQHNIRDKRVATKEAHIDLTRPHEIWIDETPQKAYERIFGTSVQAYNERQTRPERQIRDYYKAVCNDQKKHAVYEMIIGIYGKDEQGKAICSEEQGKQIMREFVDSWKENNPNLELIGAYYHADEQGEPHVHLDYIPVAHGYTKGMETQNGLVKALKEMGFEKNGRATAQIQWEARENKRLEQICNEHGLTVEHPRNGLEHLEKEQYIASQHIKGLEGQIETLEGRVKDAKDFVEQKEAKDFLGRSKGVVEVPIKDYLDMKATIDEIENIKDAKIRAYDRKSQAEQMYQDARKFLAEYEKKEEAYNQKVAEFDDKLENINDYINQQAKLAGDGRLMRLEEFCQRYSIGNQNLLEKFEESERKIEQDFNRHFDKNL